MNYLTKLLAEAEKLEKRGNVRDALIGEGIRRAHDLIVDLQTREARVRDIKAILYEQQLCQDEGPWPDALKVKRAALKAEMDVLLKD